MVFTPVTSAPLLLAPARVASTAVVGAVLMVRVSEPPPPEMVEFAKKAAVELKISSLLVPARLLPALVAVSTPPVPSEP